MTIHISLLPYELVPAARRLVNRVFPRQSLSERLSFWTYPRRDTSLVRWIYRLAGVRELIGYWVATEAEGTEVLGIAGLYSYAEDANEAVWLGWYCVAPEARGTGVGSMILDYAVERARATGKARLRLYTSTDPNEAAAQRVYEKKGFYIVATKKTWRSTLIFREKNLLEVAVDKAA